MNPEQLKEMNEITWWHTMELDGVMTPGRDFTMEKLATIKMPANLKGKKVLDVGAWDGFFSFEAERRGAEVLAIDTVMWKEGPTFNSQKNRETFHTGKRGFNFARKILNSKVKDKEMEVMDLSKETVGEFDLVLCLGILYHMENPLGMIRRMAEITKNLLILESHYDLGKVKEPVMRFYPNKECNNDPGTWWGANPECINAMLKVSGFKEIQVVHRENTRIVFHARK